ncbi:MAG: hypothetical protein ABI383_07190, partial [Acidobacteriaceae bacterium]
MNRTFDEQQAPPSQRLSSRRRTILLVIAGLLALLIAVIVVFAAKWPFTHAKVASDLEAATQSQVTINNFHQTFFPHPGCVAQGVSFRRPIDLPPMTVRTLTVVGSYAGLLSRSIPLLRLEGLRAVIPPLTGANRGLVRPGGTTNTKIGELVVEDAVLEFQHGSASGAPGSGLQFQVHEFTLENPGTDRVMPFASKLHTPIPAGEIETRGSLGPWKGQDPMATNVSGTYQLTNADLNTIRGLGGKLSSQGKYQGPLQQMSVEGSAKTPDLQVNNGNKTSLTTQFSATVNAENGNIELQQVIAKLGVGGRTELTAHGSIIGQAGKTGKVASLDLQMDHGRIDDLLRLLANSPEAPMTGTFSFKGHGTLQSAKKSFYDGLTLGGTFEIADGKFTNPQTQGDIEALSEQAEGNPKG